MKKQSLVAAIGTFALAANVLLPGLAFGQENQAAEQEIGCGDLTLNVDANNDFSMDVLNVSTSAQDSFGNLTGNAFGTTYQDGANPLPVEAFVSVDDARTVGVGAGCAEDGTDEGWTLSAAATAFVDNATIAPSIPNTGFYIATTSNVIAPGTFTEFGVDGADTNVFYTTGFGGTQDVTAIYNLADATDLTTAAPFTTENASLDSSKVILDNATGGGNNDFKFTSVGTGLAYYLSVPANQAGGTYASTVTLTLAAAT